MTQTLQIDSRPVIKDVEAALGEDSVLRQKEELLVYECDGLTSYRQRPAVVVLPRTTEQVAEAVKVCDIHRFLKRIDECYRFLHQELLEQLTYTVEGGHESKIS